MNTISGNQLATAIIILASFLCIAGSGLVIADSGIWLFDEPRTEEIGLYVGLIGAGLMLIGAGLMAAGGLIKRNAQQCSEEIAEAE